MNQVTNFGSKQYPQTARLQQTTNNLNESGNFEDTIGKTGQLNLSNRSQRRNKSLLASSRNREWWGSSNQEEFNKTTSRILKSSFRHHDSNLCVCQSCQCGRHLCQFKGNAKPNLSKTSIYKQSYGQKTPIPNEINIAGEYDKLGGPHLDLRTTFKKDFNGKRGDNVQKPKPEDLLKVGGPCQQLTSYSSGFPGFRGVNQYIKHTDNAVRSDFPMLSRTTYANAFPNRSASKPKKQKIPDSLKTRDLWMGKTTYGNFFQQPNPEDYTKRNKNTEKLQTDPKYRHQYETTYRNSFISPMPTICPAKIELQTRQKGSFKESKDNFGENTDFKSLNPNFQAISTSKHSYV